MSDNGRKFRTSICNECGSVMRQQLGLCAALASETGAPGANGRNPAAEMGIQAYSSVTEKVQEAQLGGELPIGTPSNKSLFSGGRTRHSKAYCRSH